MTLDGFVIHAFLANDDVKVTNSNHASSKTCNIHIILLTCGSHSPHSIQLKIESTIVIDLQVFQCCRVCVLRRLC